jgi:hypothetical protein
MLLNEKQLEMQLTLKEMDFESTIDRTLYR